VGIDQQASHVGSQLPNRFGGHPAVVTEYSSQLLTFYTQCQLLRSSKHIIIDIIHVEDGLVRYHDMFPGGPSAFFTDVTQVTYGVHCLVTTTFVQWPNSYEKNEKVVGHQSWTSGSLCDAKLCYTWD